MMTLIEINSRTHAMFVKCQPDRIEELKRVANNLGCHTQPGTIPEFEDADLEWPADMRQITGIISAMGRGQIVA